MIKDESYIDPEVVTVWRDDPETIRKFLMQAPLYKELSAEISYILEKKAMEANIEFSIISHRLKTLKSFIEKIYRNKCENPFKEVTDIAGVRIVYLYQSQFDMIKEIIYSEFQDIKEDDKHKAKEINRFGYDDVQYLVKLGPKSSGVRYDALKGLTCEIQVRTVLEDAWAIYSHHLSYKRESETPPQILRRLNRFKATFESMDEDYDRLRKEIESYRDELRYKQKDEKLFLEQPINFDSLKVYTESKFPDLGISERWQQRLLSDLNLNKYKYLRDIDNGVEAASEAVKAYKEKAPEFFKTGTANVTKALGFIDKDFRNKHPFSKQTLIAFRDLEHLLKENV
ncbi:MAG: GTP pyrophosphokinase YjbM [Candidatus Scalindua rubra]|uniref:GTP pyrophosphokinase YjbM n=1 Tax=Candidatus Scalindua rubra TaxID=1872076 RepID=A0A1E3XBH8_9BACT|nr:MAG: GTP pyrophosphokinase YjbM [Candidatus Scalindua rubra]